MHDLIAKFKQAVDKTYALSTHPLIEHNEHEKKCYLQALSVVIFADDNKHVEELAFFGALQRTLVPDDNIENLIQFSETKNFAELVPAVSEVLTKSEWVAMSFLIDAVMLASADGEIPDSEKALLAVLRNLIRWEHLYFDQAIFLCTLLATAPQGKDLDAAVEVFPPDLVQHILEYRGMAIEALSQDNPGNCIIPPH